MISSNQLSYHYRWWKTYFLIERSWTFNLKHGQLPFFQRDIRNLYVKMRRKNAKNHVMDLLQFCKVAKEENSRFQYAFITDEENRLEHFFGHLLIILLCTKNMEMCLFFTPLIRWKLMICLLVFLLVSIIMEKQSSLVVHFFEMKQRVSLDG